MTSILKGMKVSTYEAIMAAGNDDVRLRPLRRHARERRSRHRAVPQLREQGQPRPAAASSTRQGRHHRRLDHGELLPGLITSHAPPTGGRPTVPSASLSCCQNDAPSFGRSVPRPSAPSAVTLPRGPPPVPTPRMRCHETRPARHHQTLRQRGGQRLDVPHGRARRDPLPAGRERRRQVDPDERPLRPLQGRRGRDRARRRGPAASPGPATPWRPASAWSTSTSCSSPSSPSPRT